MIITSSKSNFKRELLPMAAEYYRKQGLKLNGGGEWKSTICPFHEDTNPSLRVRLDSGGFRCMVCGAHGGDIIAFQMQRYQMSFIQAVRSLGACEEAI